MENKINKRVVTARVLENKQIQTGIFKMIIESKEIAEECKAGQFVNVYMKNKATLLPRPISICDYDENTIILVYKVIGKGTGEMSDYKENDKISITTPLGNGFHINQTENAMLIGGGIGIAPLIALAKELKNNNVRNIIAVLGYEEETYLIDEFKEVVNEVYITTDKETNWYKGTVVDLIEEKNLFEMIKEKGVNKYACGPKPMLKVLSKCTMSIGDDIEISMEERMGCGYGACVGCAIKTKMGTQKVCKDGPVFLASQIIWE